MTAVETAPGQPTQTVEYKTALDVSAMNALAKEGWRLHSAVFCATNIAYVMQREVAP